jgi:NAD(P)-dependent dehydrogenase (short-subunit alcohol dehydrogenase family)
MTIRFDDRVAIVTGAGAGLGKQHALLLASRGAKVVVNDPGGAVDGRGGANAVADQVVAEIKAAGGEAVANYNSVADAKSAQGIIDTAKDTWGRLDILVNNAGILRDKAFQNMSIEDFEYTSQVHYMGTVYCTKAAWPVMREARYGRIVVTTSGSGTIGNFGQSNYGAAKMAVVGLINVLRLEGARYNILCNAISPSARTRMTEDLLPSRGWRARIATSPDRSSPRPRADIRWCNIFSRKACNSIPRRLSRWKCSMRHSRKSAT